MACACADKVFHMKNKKVVRYYLKYSHDEMVIDRNLIDINWYSKVCDEPNYSLFSNNISQ